MKHAFAVAVAALLSLTLSSCSYLEERAKEEIETIKDDAQKSLDAAGLDNVEDRAVEYSIAIDDSIKKKKVAPKNVVEAQRVIEDYYSQNSGLVPSFYLDNFKPTGKTTYTMCITQVGYWATYDSKTKTTKTGVGDSCPVETEQLS